MDKHLLSRITKDFLNLDPELVSPRARYRMGWGGSVLAPHSQSRPKKMARTEAAQKLLALRERFSNLFNFSEARSISLSTAPRLPIPKEPPPAHFSPPRYFSKGGLDIKALEPISYLLTETNETAKPRPVPGNTFLFRSLCRGKGKLKRSMDGLVYLDIDNRFITMIFPFLKMQGLIRPPYFNLFATPEGAHIPVIPVRESNFHYLGEIAELEREFSFEIEGLYSMQPTSWPEVEQVWFFKLHSPELENLRRRYFLTAHPGGHAFHIAVAIKPRVGNVKYAQKAPLMRINIAFLAA